MKDLKYEREASYKAIWAIAKELSMSEDDVYQFANKHLDLNLLIPVSSLKDLTQKKLLDLDKKLKAVKSL